MFACPAQIDRADFADVDAPWLVAVFSSATCTTCADVVRKAKVLRCAEVAVVDVEYSAATDAAPQVQRRCRADRGRRRP